MTKEQTYTYELDEESRQNLLRFLHDPHRIGVPEAQLLLQMYAYFKNKPSDQAALQAEADLAVEVEKVKAANKKNKGKKAK